MANRRSRVTAAVLAVGSLAAAGAAHAQSCVQVTSALTRCRFLLSQPRIYDVRAWARLQRPRASGPHALALSVDGAPCRPQASTTGDFGRVIDAGCRVVLRPAVHVVEAAAVPATPDLNGIAIRMQPNPRLAPLPREADTLYPPDHRPWFRRVLPF